MSSDNQTTQAAEFDLHGIRATELLRRAVTTARSRQHNKGVKHPRWVAVKDIFALGSGYAHELCRRFDLDPDEEVSR